MKILVSGSIAFDKIMDFPGYFKDHILPDKIHNLNVSFFITKTNENFGGTAGNISYNLGLLGEDPIILSSAGNDFENYGKWLSSHGADISRIRIIKDDRTALATMITDRADNQISAFCPGAMINSCKMDISEEGPDTLAIVAPGLMDDMVKLSSIYKNRGIPYIFDPGQAITSLSKDNLIKCIRSAKILISNDYELSMILSKTGLDEKEILLNIETLITTLGEKGSILKTRGKSFKIKSAKPNKVVDPTGAGDAYRAGFIKGLVEKWPLDVACEFAGVTACYAVENYGTQNHKFNFTDTANRYETNFNKKLPNKKS